MHSEIGLNRIILQEIKGNNNQVRKMHNSKMNKVLTRPKSKTSTKIQLENRASEFLDASLTKIVKSGMPAIRNIIKKA